MWQKYQTSRQNVHIHRLLIGTVGLLIGCLVYIVSRPPGEVYFLSILGIADSIHQFCPDWLYPLGLSLPSFLHVFAFILLTAGLLSCKRKGYLIICTSWLIVDSVFEIGQKNKVLAANTVPEWLKQIPFFENTSNYFIHGTFDITDLIFIFLGTIIAYITLIVTDRFGKEGLP